MSDGRRRTVSRAILGGLFMMAVLVNLAGPGRSDHIDVSNTSFESISCFNSTGGFIGPVGVLLKRGESLGPLLPGDLFSYQLDLSVEVGDVATNVTHQLADPLPSDFLFDSLVESETLGTITCSEPPSGSSGTVTCTLGDVVPQSLVSVDLFGSVAGDAAPGLLSNTATFTLNGTLQGDPFSCSASSTWEVEIVSPANVTADKTVSGQFFVGGTITYQVVLTNSGPAPQVDAPGNEFMDVLPSDVALDCGGATTVVAGGGTLGCNEGTNTVTWNGSIPANGSVTIQIGATIVSGTPEVPIENQGSFLFDADGDGVNDSNGTTDDPGTLPSPDPTAFVLGIAPAPSEVPAAGVLGLLALALLLAVAALPRLRD
jgi:uncharacterized repeat protein (TIGR01451 family)